VAKNSFDFLLFFDNFSVGSKIFPAHNERFAKIAVKTFFQVLLFFFLCTHQLKFLHRNHLSDYQNDITQCKWPQNSMLKVDETTGEVLENKPVYIFILVVIDNK